MSFWRFGNRFTTTSAVSKILEKPDHTLEELLDEPDLLRELPTNTALLEYLRDPKILQKLVDLIITINIPEPLETQNDEKDPQYAQDSTSDQSQDLQQELVIEDEDVQNSVVKDKNSKGQIKEGEVGSEFEKIELADLTPESQSTVKHEELETGVKISKDIKKVKSDTDNDTHPLNRKKSEEHEDVDNENEEADENDDDDDDDENGAESESETETPQQMRQRRAQVSAEILSTKVWSLADAFMESTHLLQKLWEILDFPAPLSLQSATYFMKINEYLLNVKTDEMISFIKQQSNLVERFMGHIDNPPLMDFLLKVISTDKVDHPTGVIDLLQDQHLIPSLVSFIGPTYTSSIQSAAGDFLKAFITISGNSNTDISAIGPNELTRELLTEPMVRELVRLMLYGGTGLANGVGIVIEIIRKNNSDYDMVPVLCTTIESDLPTLRDSVYLGTLVKVFAENIPKFQALLSKETDKNLPTPFGVIKPLGFEKFKICELVAELLHCSNMGLLNDIKGEEIVNLRDVVRARLKELYKAEQKKRATEALRVRLSDDDSSGGEEFDISRGLANLKLDADIKHVQKTYKFHENDQSEEAVRERNIVGDQLKMALKDNNVIITILKMFFDYPWNNFLHNVVFDIIQQILNGPMDTGYNHYLMIDLFDRGNITNQIVDGYNLCEQHEKENHFRLGYMGHLTLISEEVVKFTTLFPPANVSQLVYDKVNLASWSTYVRVTLTDTRDKYNAILGGIQGGSVDEEAIMTEDDDPHNYNLDQVPKNTVEYNAPQHQDNTHTENDVKEEKSTNKQNDEQNSKYKKPSHSAVDNEHVENSGDQFSQYMSQQMTNGLPDKLGSSDEDEEEEIGWSTEFKSLNDDDYEDPNDDGQSYARPDYTYKHFDNEHGNIKQNEEEEEDVIDDYDEDESLGLMRSTSQGESWDSDERRRLAQIAKYTEIKNNIK